MNPLSHVVKHFAQVFRPQKNIYLFPAYRVMKKNSAGRPEKKFFSHVLEGLALPISFIQPIIAYF